MQRLECRCDDSNKLFIKLYIIHHIHHIHHIHLLVSIVEMYKMNLLSILPKFRHTSKIQRKRLCDIRRYESYLLSVKVLHHSNCAIALTYRPGLIWTRSTKEYVWNTRAAVRQFQHLKSSCMLRLACLAA